MVGGTASETVTAGAPQMNGRLTRIFELTHVLAVREITRSQRGSWSGLLGPFLIPLALLVTYTFVFSVLMPVAIRPGQTRRDYGFFLFAGLIAWNLFADVVGRAPRLYLDASAYVRRPLFPLSVLVTAPGLAALYRSGFWLVAYAVARLVLGEPLAPTVLMLPVALLLPLALALGLGLALACLGVFVRDLAELVPTLLTLAFFLTPVLYPPSLLAEVAAPLTWLNPMAPAVVIARDLLFEGRLPPAWLWAVGLGWAALALALGVFVQGRCRGAVKDRV